MTYQTKQRKYKNRVELIMSIVFIVGVNVCYALTAYYFEGASFWNSLKQSLYGTLLIVVLTLITLPLIFVCLAIGRLVKKVQNKKSD